MGKLIAIIDNNRVEEGKPPTIEYLKPMGRLFSWVYGLLHRPTEGREKVVDLVIDSGLNLEDIEFTLELDPTLFNTLLGAESLIASRNKDALMRLTVTAPTDLKAMKSLQNADARI